MIDYWSLTCFVTHFSILSNDQAIKFDIHFLKWWNELLLSLLWQTVKGCSNFWTFSLTGLPFRSVLDLNRLYQISFKLLFLTFSIWTWCNTCITYIVHQSLIWINLKIFFLIESRWWAHLSHMKFIIIFDPPLFINLLSVMPMINVLGEVADLLLVFLIKLAKRCSNNREKENWLLNFEEHVLTFKLSIKLVSRLRDLRLFISCNPGMFDHLICIKSM